SQSDATATNRPEALEQIYRLPQRSAAHQGIAEAAMGSDRHPQSQFKAECAITCHFDHGRDQPEMFLQANPVVLFIEQRRIQSRFLQDGQWVNTSLPRKIQINTRISNGQMDLAEFVLHVLSLLDIGPW